MLLLAWCGSACKPLSLPGRKYVEQSRGSGGSSMVKQQISTKLCNLKPPLVVKLFAEIEFSKGSEELRSKILQEHFVHWLCTPLRSMKRPVHAMRMFR